MKFLRRNVLAAGYSSTTYNKLSFGCSRWNIFADISVDVLAVIGLGHHFLPFCSPLFYRNTPHPPPAFWLIIESKKLQEK